MANTIFVGHKPGTYEHYKTVGGWGVMFLDKDGSTRNADGGKIYPKRQNAWARKDRLNHPVKYAIKKTGTCESYWDGYTLTVTREDDGYSLKIQTGAMPPHYSQDFATVDAVEEEIREHSAMPLYLDWKAVDGE